MSLPEPKARLQRLFNHLSTPYARIVFSHLRRETQGDVAWLRPRPSEKALDLACGPGTLALELARYGCRVYGIDLAQRMIARAQQVRRLRDCPGVHFAVADAEELPLANETFDLITCAYAFPDFLAPRRVVSEISRVMRSGGRLAILEVVGPEDLLQSAALDELEQLRSAGVPAHLHSLPELLALFRQANLKLLDACICERRRRLEDWLDSAAVGSTTRRRLRQRWLATARKLTAGLHLERHRGRWFFCAKVARLLWRKP